ncbi:MAG: hypothetical protein ACI90V_005420 [Bacillariaceae sp.]|jgi:hypothetical protein
MKKIIVRMQSNQPKQHGPYRMSTKRISAYHFHNLATIPGLLQFLNTALPSIDAEKTIRNKNKNNHVYENHSDSIFPYFRFC